MDIYEHTAASVLLQTTGVAVAQPQLRHSEASTTLGHYGQILGNDHREAVEQIDRLAPAWAKGTSTKSAFFSQVDYFLIARNLSRIDSMPSPRITTYKPTS
jgi:hypothetical protein